MRKKKTIIIIMIILLIANLLLPRAVNADADSKKGETGGGSLLKPFSQFLCYVFDAVIDLLQDMFVDANGIRLPDESYSIKYSPGIIFSGDVPALDINFINPGENKTSTITTNKTVSLVSALESKGAQSVYEKNSTGNNSVELINIKANMGYTDAQGINLTNLKGNKSSKTTTNYGAGRTQTTEQIIEYAWKNANDNTICVIVYEKVTNASSNDSDIAQITERLIGYKISSQEKLEEATQIANTNQAVAVGSKEYKSTAGVLQQIVATWYNVFRKVALIGLLSALVYIGIKIVLSSTSAKDKAKYKKMLKDWLVAICLLFVLHYVMVIIITVVDNVNELVKVSSISSSGEDILMTNVRNKIYNGENWTEVLTYVVIYSALVVYTIIYTIQYIRRVIYLAFLTMIAPLITLTYPLDKIKDSKAQAFDMWLKDYIFFSLIQVVHLLIYYIFLGTAINLNEQGNWLFAIVAISFITPAEKLIKKMFGFEKAKTLGAMSAGATGALVMNAMQKIPHGGPAGGGASPKKEGSSSANLVRTAGANPFVSFPEESTSGAGSTPFAGNNPNGANMPAVPNVNNNNQKQQGDKTQSKLEEMLNSKKKDKNTKTETSSELTFKKAVKGAMKVGGKYLPSAVEGGIRFTVGMAGGTFGAATALAKGEGFTEVVTGFTIGKNAGNSVVNVVENGIRTVEEIPEKVGGVVETFREGYYGSEVVQNAKFDQVFRNSSDYKKLQEKTGITGLEFDRKVQKILDSGITDVKQMEKILKNHKFNPEKYNMDKAIKYSKLAKKCPEEILYNNAKFIRYCQDRKLGITEEELTQLRRDMMSFK